MTLPGANGRSSAMDRVLGIPELLDLIFCMMDQAANAVNAQVSKRWSSIALDALWREVDEVDRLFGILAPLRNAGGDELEFEELPSATHWRRFEKYSGRVRRLVYTHHEPKLRQSVFDDVARTRTRLNILPNMHTLVWKGPLNLSVMFMHSGVKTFDVWLPDELEKVSPQPFFHDIAVRMPNITNLNIRTYVPVHDIEADLMALISNLSKLQTVTFPRFYLTTNITEALSRLSNLGVIEFQYFDEQGCGHPDDVVPYAPKLTHGAFPTLWDHSLTARFDDVALFFNLEFAPMNLATLYIDSGIIESATSITNFLSVVADNCQLLKSLALVSLRDAGTTTPNGDAEEYKVTAEHLKPIFKLSNLKSLEFLHHYPVAFTQEDLASLASSWPSLETLILNNEPVLITKSKLSLDALLPFAVHCPKLSHLGLFLDASSIEAPLSSTVTAALTPFKRLKRLSMGVSNITTDNSVALFLSHILPLGCVVDCGITWEECAFADKELYKEAQQRCEWWTRVDELLPVLIRLRIEEKERLRAMERELDDLRMRNGILGDNVRLGVSMAVDPSTCIMI